MAVSWIVFHVTDRCQLSCRHCLRDPAQKVHDLPAELVGHVLDQACSVYQTSHIGLTGGEPTLHPDLGAIIDAAVCRGMTWHVVTNGGQFDRLLRLLEERPERREALTAIDFSLDGAEEATHDTIRGAGSYRQVMSAVSLASALKLPFVLQMTVNALNLGELETMGLVASQLGAQRVSFGMTQPTGTHFDESLRLSAVVWRAVHDRVLRLGEALRIPVVANEGFPRDQPFHVCEPFRSEILHVDYLGRLTLCCALTGVPGGEGDEVLADLRETSLVDAHRRMLELIQRFQMAKLAALENGPLSDWDLFPCNYCMRCFGKPHWNAEGAVGPRAARARQKTGSEG